MVGLTLPTTLTPNQAVTFMVKFAPTAGGNVSGNLAIVSDAPGSPLNIALSGTGLTPGSLIANPSSVNFGNVTIGGSTPNGTWNTADFNFFGLTMAQTGGAVQGASFHGSGTVTGLPPNGDWDSNLVAGIAMIAEQ